MSDVEVAVIGAGIAGLTAAREIVASGRSVSVLEARDRVGGRTLGHRLRDGTVVEMGGQHVGPVQTEVLGLLDELGLETFPTFDQGAGLMMRDGSRRTFNDETMGLPPASLPEIARLQEEIEALAGSVRLEAPWESPDAESLDRRTFDEWLRSSTEDEVALRFYRFMVHAVFSAEAWEISLLHGLFYIRSNGMIDNIVGTTGGNQERRVVGGSQRLSERMAEELPEGALRLGSPVRAIEQDERAVVVECEGLRVSAGRAIVTLPPALTGRLRYDPPLPAARDLLTQQMPMGCVIKVQAVYPTPFWREEGLSGTAFSLDEPVSLAYDNSPPDSSCGVITGFLEGDEARAASAEPEESRRVRVIDYLTRAFGPRAAHFDEYVEQDWMGEEYTRGCYGGHLAPGGWTGYGRALSAPVGRIHWAGSESADISNGYMDGAVRSARRAANEVLTALS